MMTNSPLRRLLAPLPILFAGVLGWSMSPPATAQERDPEGPVSVDLGSVDPISVDLISGARLVGQLDARSDRSQLWLRVEKGSAVLLRPIRWEQVAQARVADKVFTPEQLRQSVEQTRLRNPARQEPPGPPNRISLRIPPSAPDPALAAEGRWPISRSATLSRPATVRSVAFDATVANWDADAEMDGLLISVYPLDANGRVTAVRGMLQVNLREHVASTITRRRSPSRLEYWTRQVRVEDFGADEAVYRLPFQRMHPEYDTTNWGIYGAVHVRLSVPGQGTFEATEGTVRLRP
ncbi:MAG: hypothetical protein HQ567_30605 [Candidatus Nealsonbacteria bacterium]|nr:hypothetical protein [Candidatus Nealsonbacteria bacterium]